MVESVYLRKDVTIRPSLGFFFREVLLAEPSFWLPAGQSEVGIAVLELKLEPSSPQHWPALSAILVPRYVHIDENEEV